MKKELKVFKVANTKQITPNMIRITLVGKNLKGFNYDQIGGYVKLHFSSKTDDKKLQRPYTIRGYRKKLREIDIDFATHNSDKAIASNWAKKAKMGDIISLTGPSPKKNLNNNADWFYFVGDMSAIPSIMVNLESLPTNSKGIVVFEIFTESDKQKIKLPNGIDVIWVINQNYSDDQLLIKKIKSLVWLKGKPFIWVACEFNKMKILREFFKVKKKVENRDIYISSYWKKGLNQEEHKIVKKNDTIINQFKKSSKYHKTFYILDLHQGDSDNFYFYRHYHMDWINYLKSH